MPNTKHAYIHKELNTSKNELKQIIIIFMILIMILIIIMIIIMIIIIMMIMTIMIGIRISNNYPKRQHTCLPVVDVIVPQRSVFIHSHQSSLLSGGR